MLTRWMWSLEAGFTLWNKLIVLCHLKLKYNFSSAKRTIFCFFRSNKNETVLKPIRHSIHGHLTLYLYAKSFWVQSNEKLVKLAMNNLSLDDNRLRYSFHCTCINIVCTNKHTAVHCKMQTKSSLIVFCTNVRAANKGLWSVFNFCWTDVRDS